MPIVCSARIADSRPAPGPLTRTSRLRMPNALAALPAAIAACVAANGVPLREPLKPMPPALDHAITAPLERLLLRLARALLPTRSVGLDGRVDRFDFCHKLDRLLLGNGALAGA